MSASTTTSAPASVTPTAASKLSRLIGRPAFWVVLLAVLFSLPVARVLLRRLPPAPPVLSTIPPFAMTDQQGQPFGTQDLTGKVWVADFIFTSCPTACPMLTQRMADIEHRARRLGPDLHLVSFTVDPERDTPAKLAEYAGHYKADPHKWSFLTGPLDVVEKAVIEGFKIGIDRHKTEDDFWEIVHGEHLVVVDRHLRIRGYFDTSPAGIDNLLAALGRVANETAEDEPPVLGAPPQR